MDRVIQPRPSHDLVNFVELAGALLQRADTLVPQWLPGGKVSGTEYVCADLTGGKGSSCSVNLATGAWGDFANDDAGGDLISLYAAIHGLNQGKAARQLMHDMGWQRSAASISTSSQRQEPPIVPSEEGDPEGKPPEKRRTMWRSITPVPATAPSPVFRHFHHGVPSTTWDYILDGALYGHLCRFDKEDGRKEILPFTWCVDDSDDRGLCRWHWKQFEEPRPLYVPATTLAADARLVPVVLVEGEKCAMAGFKLLGHEYDFVSWPGGGKAWAKADWSWLKGRVVYLWPDSDSKRERLTSQEAKAGMDPEVKPFLPAHKQPGLACMVHIGSLLAASQECQVLICPIPEPGAISDGWDIADAIQQGWGPEEVRAFIRGARPFIAPDDAARAAARQLNGATDASAGASRGSFDNGAPPDLTAWRERLLTTEKGAIKAVRENVVLALDGVDLGDDQPRLKGIPEAQGVIAYNEFTNDVMKLRAPPWKTGDGVWSEVDELLMGEWLTRRHYLPSMPRGTLDEAVRMVAHRHQFHPVRTYLRALKWDGQKRLNTWLRRAVLEEDAYDHRDPLQRYMSRAGAWFLMGMCARVMKPGAKFDYMLILEGAQGQRKSTLFNVLGGDYFADTGLVLGDKDSYQQLQGRWVYEFGELDSFGKADVTKIKSFIASRSDYFRASFDKRARDYPRQVVFGGSTNEDHYLTDSTGNRRFWPIRVTRLIDIDWVSENRDQLFAEALTRFEAGERFHPTADEERELFEPQQRQRSVENAIEAAIARWLCVDPIGTLTQQTSIVELLSKIGIGVEKLGPGRFHEKQAAAALRRLGWLECGRESKPPRPRLYGRPAAAEEAADSGSDPSPTGLTQGFDNNEGQHGCPF